MSENTKQNEWDVKELGVLWKRQSRAGENYLNGKINLKSLGFDKDVSLIIFSNKNKTKDSHPDLRIYISENREDKTAAPKPISQPQKALAPKPTAAVNTPQQEVLI